MVIGNRGEPEMNPQYERENIMLLINQLADRLRPLDENHNLPPEVEREIDTIDRRLCAALGIDYDTAPSAYSYD